MVFSFSVCNIEQSYPFSRCLIYSLQLYHILFVVSKPSLWTIVLIYIRQYHVSVEVSKRLIYYLSGRVQVHVVFVFVQSV